MAPADAIGVEVVYCPAPHQVDLRPLRVAPGTTVREALRASGLLQQYGLDENTLSVGLWGRACALDLTLRERDRVEIYRPLLVDPKEARRQRYKGKAARSGRAVSGNPTR